MNMKETPRRRRSTATLSSRALSRIQHSSPRHPSLVCQGGSACSVLASDRMRGLDHQPLTIGRWGNSCPIRSMRTAPISGARGSASSSRSCHLRMGMLPGRRRPGSRAAEGRNAAGSRRSHRSPGASRPGLRGQAGCGGRWEDEGGQDDLRGRGPWFLRPTRRVRTTRRIELSSAVPGATRVRPSRC